MYMDNSELVFYKEGGKIMSAGFSIDSLLLKNGGSIMTSKNNIIGGGGGQLAHLFQDLGVPAGISYIEMKQSGGKRAYARDTEEPQILSDDIHAKLLDLVSVDSTRKAKKTRRHTVSDKKRVTKKNKI
jgi:hypothetical protein